MVVTSKSQGHISARSKTSGSGVRTDAQTNEKRSKVSSGALAAAVKERVRTARAQSVEETTQTSIPVSRARKPVSIQGTPSPRTSKSGPQNVAAPARSASTSGRNVQGAKSRSGRGGAASARPGIRRNASSENQTKILIGIGIGAGALLLILIVFLMSGNTGGKKATAEKYQDTNLLSTSEILSECRAIQGTHCKDMTRMRRIIASIHALQDRINAENRQADVQEQQALALQTTIRKSLMEADR